MKKILITILLIGLTGCSLKPTEKIQPITKSEVKSQTREIMLGADSGANSPGTMADDATVGTVAWSNPDNAKVSDNVYATGLTAIGQTHYLKATNFGFSIPTGAIINGILVEVEMKYVGNNDVDDNSIKIVKSNGSFGTQEKKRPNETWWPVSDTYISYGSSSDLWGETWTSTDINDVDFGVGISADIDGGNPGDGGYVDHIRTTVYYTEGTANPSPATGGVIFFE